MNGPLKTSARLIQARLSPGAISAKVSVETFGPPGMPAIRAAAPWPPWTHRAAPAGLVAAPAHSIKSSTVAIFGHRAVGAGSGDANWPWCGLGIKKRRPGLAGPALVDCKWLGSGRGGPLPCHLVIYPLGDILQESGDDLRQGIVQIFHDQTASTEEAAKTIFGWLSVLPPIL